MYYVPGVLFGSFSLKKRFFLFARKKRVVHVEPNRGEHNNVILLENTKNSSTLCSLACSFGFIDAKACMFLFVFLLCANKTISNTPIHTRNMSEIKSEYIFISSSWNYTEWEEIIETGFWKNSVLIFLVNYARASTCSSRYLHTILGSFSCICLLHVVTFRFIVFFRSPLLLSESRFRIRAREQAFRCAKRKSILPERASKKSRIIICVRAESNERAIKRRESNSKVIFERARQIVWIFDCVLLTHNANCKREKHETLHTANMTCALKYFHKQLLLLFSLVAFVGMFVRIDEPPRWCLISVIHLLRFVVCTVMHNK